MSAQPLPMNAGGTPSQLGRVLLRGRIAGARSVSGRDGQLWLTLVTLPAPDEFTRPAIVEIQSRQRIGKLGDDFHGAVIVGGYGNNYESKDRDTGEVISVRSARVTLTLAD